MGKAQRIIGWGAVAFGVASIFAGASPWFEGAHFEAVLVGGAFFIGGAWVLAGPELRATLGKAFRVLRDSRGSSRRAVPKVDGTRMDPLLPVRILKLAKEHDGILTVALVAMDLNVPLDQAEAGLAECVRAGNAIPDYDIPRAHALYRFPEFMPPETPRLSR